MRDSKKKSKKNEFLNEIICKLNEELKKENHGDLYKYSIDSKSFFNKLLRHNNQDTLPIEKIIDFIYKEVPEVKKNTTSLEDFDCTNNKRGVLTL